MPSSAGELIEQMNNAQHQQMLMGMLRNVSGGSGADTLAGGLASRGSAIARPLMSAGMGMMGLDPMSLGMRAGMSAWGSGAGVMGAGMAGLGVAGAVGIAGIGAGYMGSQMMSGAQQQLGLNQGLRSGYNFMNGQGGTGFTSHQGFQIGDSLRSMAGAQGPGGEIASFGELSKLASNMGRMGLSQNTRTVGEFKEKFKQMVDTLKVVAHDMGTSLEEAQKMMAGMKSSGVFSKVDAMRMSGGMRSGALAGGLALSEMSGMASIGSQISRSVGGLGRQGAFAGMKTMEQLGVAQRVGAVSEEDIYNATGQTGAEGRQAFATAQMERSASFLKSGRGRRFLASVAGKDGQLNESAAMEWMSGGDMSTGRTMELAHQNLSGIGRANFIRNEGRLRGAALEKFGGMAQAMVYKQWLASRGVSADNMDDRSMLAFQRFTGMGRDEADLSIKQIQAMPQMVREMTESQRNMAHSDSLAQYKKTHGIEGLKRKFEETKEHVQNTLQSAGARLLEHGSDVIEGWFNKTMGIYTDMATEGLSEITKNIELGGAGAKSQYNRTFGRAGGGMKGSLGSAAGAQFGEMRKNQTLQFAAMIGSTDKDAISFASKNSDFIKISAIGAMGKSPEQGILSFRQDLLEKAKTDPSARAVLDKFDKASTQGEKVALIQTMQEKAGADKSSTISTALAAEASKAAYVPGGTSSDPKGRQEIAMGRQFLGAAADTNENRYNGADLFSKGVGRTAAAFTYAGGLMVEGANLMARFGGKVMGMGNGIDVGSLSGVDDKALGAAERAKFTIGAHVSRLIGSLTGEDEKYKGVGQAFTNKETQGMIADMYSDDKSTAADARGNALNSIARLQATNNGKPSDRDKGEIQALGGSYIASKHGDKIDEYLKSGKVDGTEEVVSEFNRVTGQNLKPEEALKQLGTMKNNGQFALSAVHAANLAQDFKRITTNIASDRDTALKTGYMTQNAGGELVLSGRTKQDRRGMSEEAKTAAELGDQLTNYDMNAPSKEGLEKTLKASKLSMKDYEAMGEDEKKNINMRAAHEEYYDKTGEGYQKVGALSTEDKKKLVKSGGMSGKMAAYELQVEDRFKSLSKGASGDIGATAKLMGISLSEDELKGMKGKTTEEQVNALLAKGGMGGESKLAQDLTASLKAKTTGGKAAGVDAALLNATDSAQKKLQDNKAQAEDPNARMLAEIRNTAKMGNDILKIIAGNTREGAEKLAALETKGGGAEGGGAPKGK